MGNGLSYAMALVAILILSGILYVLRNASEKHFNRKQKKELKKALHAADKMIESYFGDALSNPIDLEVKTAKHLEADQLSPGKYSLLMQYAGRMNDKTKKRLLHFYRIAIQDHAILKAIKKNPGIKLAPFLTYIVTQQYVLIVRFTNFGVPFDNITESERIEELRLSHETTHEILEKYKVQDRNPVLDLFSAARG